MFTLPAAVAASQTIGLLGSLVVVTVAFLLEATAPLCTCPACEHVAAVAKGGQR